MSKGVLKLRVKEGEKVYIGDIEVVLEEISACGYSASLVIIADKSIKILRGAVLEKDARQRF